MARSTATIDREIRALACLGITGVVPATMVNVFVFLAYATTASVARALGVGDLRAALCQGVDGLWLDAGLGPSPPPLPGPRTESGFHDRELNRGRRQGRSRA